MQARSSFRKSLRKWAPQWLIMLGRKLRRRNALIGDYGDWASALAASRGYSDRQVLDRVIAATREVVAGRAAWDRDGAVFQHQQANEPLLLALQRIAACMGNELHLLDFGGALGSTWRQHRSYLRGIQRVSWRVVEQPHYVVAGAEFADEALSFHASIAEAMHDGAVSAVLVSGVFPYLERPRYLIESLVESGIRHVVIDRTSFARDGRQRLAVQRPPRELGGGSYPCWLFNRAALLEPLAKDYKLIAEWPGFDDLDTRVEFRGFHFERLS